MSHSFADKKRARRTAQRCQGRQNYLRAEDRLQAQRSDRLASNLYPEKDAPCGRWPSPQVRDTFPVWPQKSGQRNSLGERMRWCHPAECLSRPRIERAGDGIEFSLTALR